MSWWANKYPKMRKVGGRWAKGTESGPKVRGVGRKWAEGEPRVGQRSAEGAVLCHWVGWWLFGAGWPGAVGQRWAGGRRWAEGARVGGRWAKKCGK